MAENQYTTFKRNYNAILKSIDLLHCFGIWTPDHIKVFYSAKKLKKKIIISPLGALEPWSMLQKKYKKKLAWFIYQKKILEDCDHIHATSDDEKKHLIDLKKHLIEDKFMHFKKWLTLYTFNDKAIRFATIHYPD